MGNENIFEKIMELKTALVTNEVEIETVKGTLEDEYIRYSDIELSDIPDIEEKIIDYIESKKFDEICKLHSIAREKTCQKNCGLRVFFCRSCKYNQGVE